MLYPLRRTRAMGDRTNRILTLIDSRFTAGVKSCMYCIHDNVVFKIQINRVHLSSLARLERRDHPFREFRERKVASFAAVKFT